MTWPAPLLFAGSRGLYHSSRVRCVATPRPQSIEKIPDVWEERIESLADSLFIATRLVCNEPPNLSGSIRLKYATIYDP